MKRVLVRKTFQYDPTFGNTLSRFDGYKSITLQERDPGILDHSVKTLITAETLYCSSLRRAVESAQKYEIHFSVLSDLNEILFDLTDLVSEAEFDSYGSSLVRKRFIERFIDDSLLESRESVFSRIESVLKLLKNSESETIFLISHSFFMKILESFITTQGKIVNQPELIKNFIIPEQKTYDFGMGFDFNF